ncbi:hypothetical protein QWZ13_09355 [Reinekea marina]|nr:hypothetical protein [Reinekea marina]MDN3649115.1 hypothetical protein [Reinekea marina]
MPSLTRISAQTTNNPFLKATPSLLKGSSRPINETDHRIPQESFSSPK